MTKQFKKNEKFEIINNSWIKKIDNHPSEFTICGYEAIKISSINSITTYIPYRLNTTIPIVIKLSTNKTTINFEYSDEEVKIYKKDLKTLESIIYKID